MVATTETRVSRYYFGSEEVLAVNVDGLLYHLPARLTLGRPHAYGKIVATFKRETDKDVTLFGHVDTAWMFTDDRGPIGVLLPETWVGPKILVGWAADQLAWCQTVKEARDFLSRMATFDSSFEEGDRPADSDERLLDEMERCIQLRSDKDSLLGS